jgi:hypothetical protein
LGSRIVIGSKKTSQSRLRKGSEKPASLSFSEARVLARKIAPRYSGRNGVDHIGIGHKRTRGIVHPVISIIFYVTSKKPDHEGKALPRYLYTKNAAGQRLRVPTDVIEIGGRPKLFNLRAARKVKGFFNDVGVSALTFASTKGNFVVTNAHVVASVSNGGQSGQVDVFDAPGITITGLGAVRLASPILEQASVTADVALVQLTQSEPIDSWSIDTLQMKVKYVEDFKAGDSRTHYFIYQGQRCECANPVFIPSEANARVELDGQFFHYGDFWKLTMQKGESIEGQSGSLIFRPETDGLVAVGIGFGGVDPGEIWAFSAKQMWNYLRIGSFTD